MFNQSLFGCTAMSRQELLLFWWITSPHLFIGIFGSHQRAFTPIYRSSDVSRVDVLTRSWGSKKGCNVFTPGLVRALREGIVFAPWMLGSRSKVASLRWLDKTFFFERYTDYLFMVLWFMYLSSFSLSPSPASHTHTHACTHTLSLSRKHLLAHISSFYVLIVSIDNWT